MGTGNIGEDYDNHILDAALGNGRTADFPATLYMSLWTTRPGRDGSGTEVSGGSYARVAVTNNSTNFPDAAGGIKGLATAVQFPTAGAVWGIAAWWALMDASSGGSVVFFGRLSGQNPPLIEGGTTARIRAGTLAITIREDFL